MHWSGSFWKNNSGLGWHSPASSSIRKTRPTVTHVPVPPLTFDSQPRRDHPTCIARVSSETIRVGHLFRFAENPGMDSEGPQAGGAACSNRTECHVAAVCFDKLYRRPQRLRSRFVKLAE